MGPIKFRAHVKISFLRGRSSVGRALAWHARGQGFDSPRLHHLFEDVLKIAQGNPWAIFFRIARINPPEGGNALI